MKFNIKFFPPDTISTGKNNALHMNFGDIITTMKRLLIQFVFVEIYMYHIHIQISENFLRGCVMIGYIILMHYSWEISKPYSSHMLEGNDYDSKTVVVYPIKNEYYKG